MLKNNDKITLPHSSILTEDTATDEQKAAIARLRELGINPFTVTDQYGRKYRGYMIDEQGNYWGTRNTGEEV